jgi:RNA polymerase sigma factor (sigma-70 family)
MEKMHLYQKKAIKSSNSALDQILQGCLRGELPAQNLLYERYSGLLLGICRRYISQVQDAEDVMIEAFVKIFQNLKQFDGRGSFEGWIKKITVNEALMWIRKRKILFNEMKDSIQLVDESPDVSQFELQPSEILGYLDQLPIGYKTVFNLYVIEEMKHREIATALGISINTSKSQLILAKKKLKSLIESNSKSSLSIKK